MLIGPFFFLVSKIEFHPYVLKAAEPILKLHEKYGIVTASFGGQTPLLPHRVSDAAVRNVLEKIAERLSASEGRTITPGQVLFKWMKHRNVVVVT
jgi:diketogulonate reductase-like aldo/keto reductase